METEMPQRFLRPGITDSEKWNRCDWISQSFFIRLITLVDDFGRFEANPKLLRGHAFALRDDVTAEKVADMCKELAVNELAIFYVSNGKQYVQLTTWNEKARAERSKFPSFDNTCEQMFSDVIKCSVPSPSSPSSSPLPSSNIAKSHKPSLGGIFSEMKGCIAAAFKRGQHDFWTCAEEQRLLELCNRPEIGAEWLELLAFRVTPESYFPQKIGSLLEDWQGTLDRARNKKESNATNTNARKEVDRNAGTFNAGKASQYANVGKRALVAIPDPQP